MLVAAELDKIKLELINWITSLDDERQLRIVDSIRLSWSDDNADWWNDLSELQKAQIEMGLKDVEDGNFMTSIEFWKAFKSGKV